MRGSARVFLSVLAFSIAFASGYAADEPGAATSSESTSRPRTSPISSRLSAAIRAKLPDYSPPPAETREARADVDSEVVVLAPIFVRERRQPAETEWGFLTESGRAALLKERYKGATVPGAPLTESVHNYAMQMNRDEMRLERLAELDDAEDIYRATGYPDDWKNLKKEVLKARMRPKDMRAESMDRSYNNDRR